VVDGDDRHHLLVGEKVEVLVSEPSTTRREKQRLCLVLGD
jgi:hypothetical protein